MEMVGKKIREARKAAKLTLERASELADCNPRFLVRSSAVTNGLRCR
jgi:hypothetical protein